MLCEVGGGHQQDGPFPLVGTLKTIDNTQSMEQLQSDSIRREYLTVNKLCVYVCAKYCSSIFLMYQFKPTYITIQCCQQLPQLHHTSLGSVDINEPLHILVKASKKAAFQVKSCETSKLCFNLVGIKEAKKKPRDSIALI